MTKDKIGTSPFFEFLAKRIHFWTRYLSIHFPFTEKEILEYWDVLEPGTAHYTAYVRSTGKVCDSLLGLCYNQNISWSDLLRSKWQIGLDDPVKGYIIGIEIHPIEYEDIYLWKKIIPLNLNTERGVRLTKEIEDCSNDHEEMEEWFQHRDSRAGIEHEESFSYEYSRMTLDTLNELYFKYAESLMFNRSIWYNTLYYEITSEEVLLLLKIKRYIQHYTETNIPNTSGYDRI